MIAPARSAALRVLQLVDRGATLAAALVQERDRLPDARDRALVTELASGTLRWRAWLDAVLSRSTSRTLETVDPVLRHVLRLAAYQLLFLDRIPARAVVDDAVEQTREARHASATGFVNGVLRALIRAQPERPSAGRAAPGVHAPGPAGDGAVDLDTLSTELSHPRWLIARWVRRYGVDAARQWAWFNNVPAPLTLRANRLRASREELAAALAAEGVTTVPTDFAADGLRVTDGQPLGSAAARAGLFVVQDESSQLVGELASLFAGPCMLDTCAAPGGKTLILASAPAAGLVVAADRRPKRLRLLRTTLDRCGAGAVRLTRIDLRRGLPFRDRFDLVLVDAPCSGLGTLRREPDIKWRRSEDELAAFADAQGRMLDVAARTVAPGGHLVYATCSSEPDEDEDVVAGFVERTPAFTAVQPLPPNPAPGLARLIDAAGHLRTYPHEHGLEAFFGAVLRRRL